MHPLLPSTVGSVCEGNFPSSSPRGAHCNHEQKPRRIRGCAGWEEKVGPGRGFWIWSAQKEIHQPELTLHMKWKWRAPFRGKQGQNWAGPSARATSGCQPMPGAEPREMPAEFPGWISHPSPGLSHAQGNTAVSKLGVAHQSQELHDPYESLPSEDILWFYLWKS